jgi:hypothetical protein
MPPGHTKGSNADQSFAHGHCDVSATNTLVKPIDLGLTDAPVAHHTLIAAEARYFRFTNDPRHKLHIIAVPPRNMASCPMPHIWVVARGMISLSHGKSVAALRSEVRYPCPMMLKM